MNILCTLLMFADLAVPLAVEATTCSRQSPALAVALSELYTSEGRSSCLSEMPTKASRRSMKTIWSARCGRVRTIASPPPLTGRQVTAALRTEFGRCSNGRIDRLPVLQSSATTDFRTEYRVTC